MRLNSRINQLTVGFLILTSSLIASPSSYGVSVTATGTNPTVCDQVVNDATGVSAIRLNGGDCLVQFTSTAVSYEWTAPSQLSVIRILGVGAGGGGGGAKDNGSGGGGGAGQVKEVTNLRITSGQTFSISVGAGGIAGVGAAPSYPTEVNAGVGGQTLFALNGSSLISALGGNPGGGSRIVTPGAANSIPSGGIGGTAATASTQSQGGSRGSYLGGGGGGGGSFGNGGTGAAGSSGAGGTAGSGTASFILDSASTTSTTFGTGGVGGVPSTTLNGSNGSSNTGNGGKGAGAGASTGANGGSGGSGLLAIRYNPTPISINSLTINGGGNVATFRSTIRIDANVSASSKVTFFTNNKRIAGCINLSTSGTSPNIVASCSWKPSRRGSASLFAIAIPAIAQVNGLTNSPLQISVQSRTIPR